MFKNNVKVIKKCQVKISKQVYSFETLRRQLEHEHGSIQVLYRLSKS
jgi:hypothetical protein